MRSNSVGSAEPGVRVDPPGGCGGFAAMCAQRGLPWAYSRAMRALVFAMVVTGCASGSGQGPAANNPNGSEAGLICKEETPTGTNMSRRVCRTPDQINDDRQAADDFLRSPAPLPTKSE